MEAGGLPVVWYLGREPKPQADTLERTNRRARVRVRCLPVSGKPPPDDRARRAVRRAGLSMATRQTARHSALRGTDCGVSFLRFGDAIPVSSKYANRIREKIRIWDEHQVPIAIELGVSKVDFRHNTFQAGD